MYERERDGCENILFSGGKGGQRRRTVPRREVEDMTCTSRGT